jgi:hypothetical protein
MANISLSDLNNSNLNPVGSELLQDSESYLNELNEKDITDVLGGTKVIDIDIKSKVGNSINANSKKNVNTVAL